MTVGERVLVVTDELVMVMTQRPAQTWVEVAIVVVAGC
jgi:hypothetical protein